MKTFFDLSRERRSVRKYSGQKLPKKDMDLCLDAARFSPSACNSQPWKFIIVDDPAILSGLSASAFSGMYSMNRFAADAAALIMIISEKQKIAPKLGSLLQRTDLLKIDIGIACAHIVLQARELGIGTCILGWFNERAIRKALSVPPGRRIELVISLGYPDSSVRTNERRLKDRRETVALNGYSS